MSRSSGSAFTAQVNLCINCSAAGPETTSLNSMAFQKLCINVPITCFQKSNSKEPLGWQIKEAIGITLLIKLLKAPSKLMYQILKY